MKKSASRETLGAPLPFIRVADEEEAGALEAFRMNYASYRLGAIHGAKGEVTELNMRKDAEAFLYGELAEANKALAEAKQKVRELLNTTRDLEAIRAAFATSDDLLNEVQRTARQSLRVEIESRLAARTARVEAAVKDVLGKAGKGHVSATTYQFTTGAPVRTDVLVARGIVAQPEQAAFEIIPSMSASSTHFVFTDETVDALYGERFVEGFAKLGYRVHKIVVPDGEDAKTLEVFSQLADKVLAIGIDKYSILVSLGGGAVANLCGFIASTLHRGIGLIHFPTTLLAQVDAAISHKQAVNAPHGKNLVGSYYAPLKIIVDPDVLQTLEDWLLPDGFGEIVKHALCQDTEVLLKTLDEHEGPITDPDFLEKVTRRTIELKCEVIDVDPKEKREAVVLIYGHELAHAIETVSHRPGSLCCLSHGQAVAIGCVVSARVSVALGCCDPSVIDRTIALCRKYHLPTEVPPDQSIDAIMKALRKTKVYTAEGCQFALLEQIGRLFNVDAQYHLPVSDDVIRAATEATMAPPGTVILGVGSSGFLRRKKVSKNDLIEAADNYEPGAGWTLEAGNAPHAC